MAPFLRGTARHPVLEHLDHEHFNASGGRPSSPVPAHPAHSVAYYEATMNASTIELALEAVPLALLGIAVYRMLISAGFHNTKYSRPRADAGNRHRAPSPTMGYAQSIQSISDPAQ